MTTVAQYRDGFHAELKSFLKNLCKTFEDDRELLVITSSLHMALMDDPDDQVISQFKEAIMPYGIMVEQRDPAFFYQTHASGKEYKLLTKLNVYWENLSPENQKIVWDYLQILYKLCRKIPV